MIQNVRHGGYAGYDGYVGQGLLALVTGLTCSGRRVKDLAVTRMDAIGGIASIAT